MTDNNDIPTLRQMPEAIVGTLCDRADRLALDSYTIRLESNAFRKSRTPWDATRLANALHHYDKASAFIHELVADIDEAAEDCAGVVPPNRDTERL